MFIKRKRPEDKADADRQLMIAYKRTFESEHGRVVLLDMINRHYFLQSHGDGNAEREKGKRIVVEDVMGRVFTKVEDFERLLKGEVV